MQYKKAVLAIVFSILMLGAFAQSKKDLEKVVLDDLINETQFSMDDAGSDDVTIVWWVPTEFWGTIYAQDPSVDEETAHEIVSALDKYTLVLVVDGTVSGLGSFKSKSEKELRKNLVVFDEDGEEYLPMDKDDLSYEASMVLNILEPVLTNLLGQLGEGMHVIPFEKKNGGKVLDAYSDKGELEYMDKEVGLDLPLASLLNEKTCPKDGAKLNPKWNYCPHHGDRLE